ncbi:MarR family winged helix-turn-helix transcriptional regulator [Nocardioides marmorisolisilvae]|uniref:MarR family transcriptional regulator n=1 Tax=Nocardioides marmorisolisilvae TaxID=1542737 RepID=A0A3N0DQ97_9ACTN|nr:MarR family transcriptional regulator [Nocardioides marmorisolisilvae]RNL77681.1 MarR family transcriptional regulator [Nocardioides marmorisolisilvae]
MPTSTTGVVELLEQELTLLSRHQLSSAHHNPDLVLDRSAYQLLGRLELEPLSLKQLAELFRLDVSTVNRQIASLRRKGLVERIADPAGGVAQLLRPTRKGLSQLRADRSTRNRQIGQVLEDWHPDEIDHLHQVLEKFNLSIESLEGQAWPRP